MSAAGGKELEVAFVNSMFREFESERKRRNRAVIEEEGGVKDWLSQGGSDQSMLEL